MTTTTDTINAAYEAALDDALAANAAARDDYTAACVRYEAAHAAVRAALDVARHEYAAACDRYVVAHAAALDARADALAALAAL